MQHAIIFIVLVLNLIAQISNIFSPQNLFQSIVLKSTSFLVIIHSPRLKISLYRNLMLISYYLNKDLLFLVLS